MNAKQHWSHLLNCEQAAYKSLTAALKDGSAERIASANRIYLAIINEHIKFFKWCGKNGRKDVLRLALG